MKTPVLHQHSDHRQAQSYRSPEGHLIDQRARLRILIYIMEHDQSIKPQRWQLQSLKQILSDIDRRIAALDIHTPRAGTRRANDENSTSY